MVIFGAMNRLAILIIIFLLSSCARIDEEVVFHWKVIESAGDFAQFVDPMIGTAGHGHTFPGATAPFGMVQLSPDTRVDGSWDGCSGYHYSDSVIFGFSHTHLSGTGCSDYGDILLMPGKGEIHYTNGTDGKRGYGSRFSHADEKAEAGYYSVELVDPGIKAELTASPRVGMHRYSNPEWIVLDLAHRDEVLATHLEVVNDHTIRGYRFSKAWATDQRLWFYAEFSEPFLDCKFWSNGKTFTADSSSNKDLRVSFTFETKQPVLVKVALSPVSCANAKLNMETEVPGWDFEDLRKKVRNDWNTELSKIEVQETSLSKKRIFYTALYHCFIAPNIYCDVNGDYMGRDKKIHRDTAHAQYTVFSLWDTYRALHPLFTIVQPERNRDFIHTFLKQYKEGGRLPVWELSANETDCMIGYHSVSVIVDAWMKGQTDFDTALAYEAMKASAMADERGLKSYKKCGYIPAEAEGESVSKTLEYAYDDWCIMQAAERMGNKEDFLYFMLRAQSWRNVFDEQTRFMRARFNNSFMEPFDPGEVNAHFTEANAWQYSLAVQQDVNGLIYSMGGNEAFLKHLDKLFSASSGTSGRKQPDITGLIGQYAHGNEPSHHMAYLACNAESPFIAQDFIRRIMNDLYSDQPDGLCGNEDCGQMSAWYVLSALGFYQVTPGLDQFVIGIPAFEEVILNFGNKKTKLTVRGAYPDETYLIGTWINGKNNNKGWFTLADITTGSQIDYIMSAGPVSEDNAYDALDMTTHSPFSGILIPAAPRIQSGQGKSFEDELKIELITNVSDPVISYRLNDGSPQQYSGPFLIRENTKLEAWASNDPDKFEISYGMSGISYAEFIKAPGWKVISITHPYAAQYSAGGKNALVDGIRGGLNFRSGEWQGYEKNDMEVVIDLGSRKQITGVSCGFLQDPGVWIWLPEEVVFYASEDGKKFTRYDLYKNTTNEKINSTENCASGKLQKARYIKLVAKNRGTCPAWHPGNGKPCWLFADEIIIETK